MYDISTNKGGNYMAKTFYKELGKIFASIRKSHSYSQQYVADRLKVSRSLVSSWETGERNLYMDDFIKLCDIYNVDPNEVSNKVKKLIYKD